MLADSHIHTRTPPEQKTAAHVLDLLDTIAKLPPPLVSQPAPVESSIDSVDLDLLSAPGAYAHPALIAKANILFGALPIRILGAPQLELLPISGLDSSLLSVGTPSDREASLSARLTTYERSSDTLTSAQLASLPVVARDWTSFLSDARPASPGDKPGMERTERPSAQPSVDGHALRSAFDPFTTRALTNMSETAVDQIRTISNRQCHSCPERPRGHKR
jgi:hypothetical protein